MPRVCAFLFALVLATTIGCKSRTITPYIAPRVAGQVVDSGTGAPIADVKVLRNAPQRSEPAKPGEALIQPEPARSDKEGHFELASARSLTLFGGGWHTVSLRFAHKDYANLETNYTAAKATNLPSGEPLVLTGTIYLTPKEKP